MKVAVIGGGSTYTPELVSGLSRERERIDVTSSSLHDIDAERRDVVGGLARRMLERQGFDGELEVTGDLDRAVDGADFVLIQIRVGGQAARLSDETVPLPCGCVGQETTGAGGFAKALRTVPVVLEIADRVRELRRGRTRGSSTSRTRSGSSRGRCSTRATARSGSATWRSGCSAGRASCSGSSPRGSLVDQVGLNHLTWVRALRVDGEDVLPGLLAARGAEVASHVGLPGGCSTELGVIPSSYLHYFYCHDVLVEQLRRRAARGGRRGARARAARAYAIPA